MDTLSHLIHPKKHSKQIQQDASLPLAFLLDEQTKVIQILQTLFTVP